MTGVPPKFLVGAHEIAERLNLSHAQSVHTIRKRHANFPAPVATLKTALIWDWRDVEKWAHDSGRLNSTNTQSGPRTKGKQAHEKNG